MLLLCIVKEKRNFSSQAVCYIENIIPAMSTFYFKQEPYCLGRARWIIPWLYLMQPQIYKKMIAVCSDLIYCSILHEAEYEAENHFDYSISLTFIRFCFSYLPPIKWMKALSCTVLVWKMKIFKILEINKVITGFYPRIKGPPLNSKKNLNFELRF